MKINSLQIVSIPVRDQNVARQFYTDVLGFRVVADNPMGENQRWIQLAPEGGQTSITLVAWFKEMPPGSVRALVLQTDDVGAAHLELMEKGVVVDPIEDAPWGRYTTFTDPDGNGLVLQQMHG